MKSEQGVVKQLNLVLRDQLTAINQYFLHARMAGNWGLGRLDAYNYKWSIKAMKQADDLIERVLLLEGLPNLQDLGKLLIGEDVEEMLHNDLQLATEVRGGLQQAIAFCESAQDYVSRELLETIMGEEEEHIDWLESQLWLIEKSGMKNYAQSMMSADE